MIDTDVRVHAIRCGTGTAPRFEHSRAIQQAVFVDEQGVDRDHVFANERDATHYVLYALIQETWTPVACARVRHLTVHCIKIERVAVLQDHRGKKYARKLLEELIDEQGTRYSPEYFFLNSQVGATGLYMNLGFRQVRDVFNEAGIQHIRMELAWPRAS